MNCSCVLVSVLWATPQWLLHKPENWRIDVSADEAAKFGCNEFRFRLNTSVTIVAIVCLNVILLCVCFRPAKYPPPPHCTGVESNTCLDVIHGRGLLLLNNKSMVPDPVVLGSQDLPSMFRRFVAWIASVVNMEFHTCKQLSLEVVLGVDKLVLDNNHFVTDPMQLKDLCLAWGWPYDGFWYLVLYRSHLVLLVLVMACLHVQGAVGPPPKISAVTDRILIKL